MMKPHIELRPKNALRLKMKPTLVLATVGLSLAIVVCVGLFFFQIVGNSENAKAGLNKKFKFHLFGQSSKGEVGSAVEVELSSTDDSLYIEFMSVDQNEIKSAVLNLSDFGNSDNQNVIQSKTYTLQSARKIGDKNYLFAISLKEIPTRVIVEAKANILSVDKNEIGEAKTGATLINRVSFNREDYTFNATPAGLKANNISVKSATASWMVVENAIKYKVRCRETGSTNWITGTVLAPGNQRPFVNLKSATVYEFQVQAYTRKEKVDSTGYSPLIQFTTAAIPKL